MKNKTLCNECGKEFNSKGASTKHMKTHQTDLADVDASILRENFKDRVLKFSNSNTLEETAEKFNLNRRVLEDWLKIASRQFCHLLRVLLERLCSKVETDRAPEEVALHQGEVGHVRGGEAPEAERREGQVGCHAKPLSMSLS